MPVKERVLKALLRSQGFANHMRRFVNRYDGSLEPGGGVRRRELRSTVLGVLFFLVAIMDIAKAAAPSALYGKSVIVSYVNTSVLRRAGTQEAFHTTNTPRQIEIYISTTGRPFMRASRSDRSGRGREQVGALGSTLTGGASFVEFEGRSLIIVFVFKRGGSRFQIDFGPDFASCTVTVVRGKVAGASTYLFRNARGTTFEIRSSIANNINCLISDGNVFAD